MICCCRMFHVVLQPGRFQAFPYTCSLQSLRRECYTTDLQPIRRRSWAARRSGKTSVSARNLIPPFVLCYQFGSIMPVCELLLLQLYGPSGPSTQMQRRRYALGMPWRVGQTGKPRLTSKRPIAMPVSRQTGALFLTSRAMITGWW